MRCPDGAALAAWVDGEVAGLPATALEGHVARCVRCARASRAERQVKRRTVSLRTEAGAVRPAPDLLSVLMTVPQAEHDRAVRRAHQASCGGSHHAANGRLRGAAIGVGASLWLIAAVWSSPAGLPSTGTASNSAAHPPASVDVAPAVARGPAAPVVAAGFFPVGVTSALAPAEPVPAALSAPLARTAGVGESAASTTSAVPTGRTLGSYPPPLQVIAGR